MWEIPVLVVLSLSLSKQWTLTTFCESDNGSIRSAKVRFHNIGSEKESGAIVEALHLKMFGWLIEMSGGIVEQKTDATGADIVTLLWSYLAPVLDNIPSSRLYIIVS